jgi:phosphoenolpyruvate carboxylase
MPAAARRRSESPNHRARPPTDKDQPLIEDIRLLGRILGDVIREQEGAPAYELVEQVRQLSVAFRRDADQAADKALKKLLKGLSGDQTVSVIRAFTYFSHLANLAEDRHHIRRRAVHERAGNTQEGSIEVALRACAGPASTPMPWCRRWPSFVALTAHPTEVQRQSILAAERHCPAAGRARRYPERAQLYAAKDALSPASWRRTRRSCSLRGPAVADALLRHSKLTVADEIENALSLLRGHVPARDSAIYASWSSWAASASHSFLRMGQWIGGDRDGNPNVTAETLALALRRQAEVALRHYLTEVHYLGGELSLSAAWSDHARDAGTGRCVARPQCAPRGRALSPRADRHARLAGRHAAADGRRGGRHRGAAKLCTPRSFWPICASSTTRCRAPWRCPGAQRLRR